VVTYYGDPAGLDMVHGLNLMAEIDNKAGGWDIGGQKYRIQLVTYDSNANQNTETAAINRLVSEDRVNCIISFGLFAPTWLPITDNARVLVGDFGPDHTSNLAPTVKYSFNPTFQNVGGIVFEGWFLKNYPDLTKNIVTALPDDQMGHVVDKMIGSAWEAFGVKTTSLFYPANTQDLSSLGTKVSSMNPSAFEAIGGGGVRDPLVFKAVYQAGYRGQLIYPMTASLTTFSSVMPAEMLEGLISGTSATEFDPALTTTAQEFKEAWIAEYDKWENPDVMGTCNYTCFKAAYQQAGSLDADKVAAVIFDGLKFDSAIGAGQMISRPDLGNERTVDSAGVTYIKQIKGGAISLIATVDIDEALGYFYQAVPTAQSSVN